MKILEYLFYGVFNVYYKNGKHNGGIPWYTSMMIFAAVFFSNIVSVIYFTTKDKNDFPLDKLELFLIGALSVLMSYLFFIKGKKYERIYNRFNNHSTKQVALNYLMSWTYVIGSFILLLIHPFIRMIEKY